MSRGVILSALETINTLCVVLCISPAADATSISVDSCLHNCEKRYVAAISICICVCVCVRVVRAPSMPHRSLQNKKELQNPKCLSGLRGERYSTNPRNAVSAVWMEKKNPRRSNNNRKEQRDSAKVITGDDYRKNRKAGLSRFASWLVSFFFLLFLQEKRQAPQTMSSSKDVMFIFYLHQTCRAAT